MIKYLLLFSWLWLLSTPAFAHVAGGVTDTGILITSNSQLTVVYTAPIANLKTLNTDEAGVEQAIREGLVMKNGEAVCTVKTAGTLVLNDIASQQFKMEYDCGAAIETLTIEYKLFIDQLPNHQNFTRLAIANVDRFQDFVFSAEKRQHQVPLGRVMAAWQKRASQQASQQASMSTLAPDAPAASGIRALFSSTHYFPIGVKHILFGFDHLLFLLALLMLPIRIKPLLALVTSFTVAHSITLGLSVLDIVNLPAAWVEVAIAFSIVYVALENLYELQRQHQPQPVSPWKRRVVVTFLFGLIHGFGFSYILKEIGLGDQVASALLFFNLGVEAGQLLAILLIFPVLLLLFKQKQSRSYMQVGSVLIGLMGAFWLVERLMG